ncbi:alpha/beta hydrolase family protein [Arenicella xantha]|uniref:Prolyl oligopeptidase family protein n=1 Tax=Arenicella xantha TaxID=644221 RepID=A0A395JNG5_9GAMM|nr:prolyl oligopeptidase family serine peptidase [Arenicella xantha]RBP51138.1 prolyl oligopeptidase family protein [Arenicella xantha]
MRFRLPSSNSRQSPPLIVIPHGGPHGVRDHWQFDEETQLLANRGYAVLKVNFRGSGGYGEAFEKLGYKEWGGKMIDDIIDATNWVAESGQVDQHRMCIYGASYGGYAALMAAIRAPDLYRCTVGYVGVYDLPTMYSDSDIPRNWGGVGYLEKVIGRNDKQLAEYSPVNHADKIKAEIMLIHATEDRRVPIKHADLLREALEDANKKFTYLEYGDSGHGLWNVDKRKDMYTKLLAFFDKSLN